MSDQEQPSNGGQPQDSRSEPFREVPPDLQKILDDHKTWVETSGKKGQKADLQGNDFQGLDLVGVNLRKANLTNTSFQGTNLLDADLRETDLSEADLSCALDLQVSQLAGADLTNACLPDAIKDFKELGQLAETSRICSHFLFYLLLICIYALLTISATKDVALILNTPTTPLPVVGGTIPIVGFYLVAPIILAAFYGYFHILLLRLWEGFARLPAIFPDGRRIDQVSYPWIFNGLLYSYAYGSSLEDSQRLHFSRLQILICLLLAWGVVPLTLLAIWARYLLRRDVIGTIWHLLILGGSFWFGLLAFFITIFWLRRDVALGSWGRWAPRLISSVLILLCGSLSMAFINANPQSMVAQVSQLLGYTPFGNLRGEQISTNKPFDWKGTKEQIKLVTGAQLRGIDLRYADAFRTFLVKADLRGAVLIGTNLTEAELQMANLRGADLQGAKLYGARLQGADLRWAKLQGAALGYAQLQGANLEDAQLQGADLGSARLQGADLKGAELQGADLGSAQLQGANLAFAQLQGANLAYARLQGADLRGAQLQGADFRDARLYSVGVPDNTELIDARGVVWEPLPDDKYRALINNLPTWIKDPDERQLVLGRLAAASRPGAPQLRLHSCLARQSISPLDCDNWYDPDNPAELAAFKKELHAYLVDPACASPWIAQGLIEQIPRFITGSSRQGLEVELKNRLDEKKCPGLRGLSQKWKDRLKAIK